MKICFQTSSYSIVGVTGVDICRRTLNGMSILGLAFRVLLLPLAKPSMYSFSNNGAGVCGSIPDDVVAHEQQNVFGPSVTSYELLSSPDNK